MGQTQLNDHFEKKIVVLHYHSVCSCREIALGQSGTIKITLYWFKATIVTCFHIRLNLYSAILISNAKNIFEQCNVFIFH